jgi:hypothetical protein
MENTQNTPLPLWKRLYEALGNLFQETETTTTISNNDIEEVQEVVEEENLPAITPEPNSEKEKPEWLSLKEEMLKLEAEIAMLKKAPAALPIQQENASEGTAPAANRAEQVWQTLQNLATND